MSKSLTLGYNLKVSGIMEVIKINMKAGLVGQGPGMPLILCLECYCFLRKRRCLLVSHKSPWSCRVH